MKNAFKKRKLQILSWIVAITMLATQLGTSTLTYAATVDESEVTETTTTTNSETETGGSSQALADIETPDETAAPGDTSSPSQTVTTTNTAPVATSSNPEDSVKSISEILLIAVTDGGQAANLLNTYTNLESFEDGVRQILDQYYSGDANNQLTSFAKNIDQRADEIIKNYKEAALERSKEGELNYVPGEVIVVFEEDTNTEKAADEIEESQAATIQMIEPQEVTVDESEIAVAEISLEQTVEDAIEEIEKEDNVAYAQPNYLYSLPEDELSTSTASVTSVTNDPYSTYDYYDGQWYLKNINASTAWDFMKKCSLSTVRVAVLDTGVDTTHPDLQSCLNKNLCVDATTTALAKSTSDNIGHGTHVSGIIGATSNNALGITGVATGVSNDIVDLMVVDVFTGSGEDAGADTLSIIRGLDYAQKQGAKIINMSLGLYWDDPSLQAKINTVTNSGSLIICAAGNDSLSLPFYPSDYSACISVIATDSNNQIADFSNYGDAKDISAPGTSILSTIPGSKLANYDGTSMASPVVAAVAAMALSVKPSLKPLSLKNLLYATAADVTSYGVGRDNYSGYGVVNAYKAVTSAANASVSTGVTLANTSLNCGTSKRLSATLSPSYSLDSVTWTSSNASIVSINSTTGVITANKVGSATVTATTGSGKKASCIVTVNIARPTISLRSTSYKSVTLTWNGIAGATKYMVYRASSANGRYKLLKTTTSRIYADKKLKLGTKYYYKVKAIGINGAVTKANLSSAFRTTPKVGKVSTLKANSLSKTKIKLTWKKVAGATSYKIYRATSKKGSYKYLGTTNSTKYYSESLKSKKTYYYKIVAVRTYKKKNYKSSYSSIISCKTK